MITAIKNFILKHKSLVILTAVAITVIGFTLWSLTRPVNQMGASGVNDIYSPYKIEGWKDAWITDREYDGIDLSDNALVLADNIDFGEKTSIAPRRGSSVIGATSSSQYPIYSMHTSNDINGRELMLRTSTGTIEWYNEDNTTWENLDSGYTINQQFTFADGNDSDETNVYTYFSNGVEAIKRFRVAFDSVSSNNASELTINSVIGYNDLGELGFSTTTGNLRINGTTYSYASTSGWTFGGMTLPALTEDIGVISAVETSGFTSPPPTAVAIVIKDQRLFAAYKNAVYCSKIDSLQDFSYSAPRVSGEGEIAFFPDGGQKINGLGIRPDYITVMKDNYIGSLEFKDFGGDLNDTPTISTISNGYRIGATSQKAISNLGFEVIYSDNDIGLADLTRKENTDFDQTVRITEQIRPTLEDYDFSDSAIVIEKNLILNSTRSENSTFNNRIVMYDAVSKRITQLIGWNAKSFTVYKGSIYYGDAITQNVYKIFTDNYDDAGLPYNTNWKTKWFNLGEPARWKELGWIYVEGFINGATTMKFKINLDDGGSLTSKEVSIIGSGSYVSKSTTNSSNGFNPFGLLNFSNISGSSDNLLHFSGYINTSDITKFKFRNIQFEGNTSGVGSNYRISKIILYANVLDEQYGRQYSDNIISN